MRWILQNGEHYYIRSYIFLLIINDIV